MGFRTHAHVGVVVFAEKFPKSWQPVIIKIRHIISTAVVAILFVVSCNCFMQYVDSGKLTTATHIPTAVVYVVIPISMALAIVHTIVDIKEDLFRQKRKQQKVRARKYDRNNFIRYIFSITCNWCSYRIVSRRCSVTGCIYFRRCSPIVLGQRMFGSLDSFTIMAIPLFMLAGNLMSSGGISKRLTDFCDAILGWMPGGLGVVSILSCMIFGALSGSPTATCAAIGSIMVPAMIEAGYDKRFALASVAVPGVLGCIIPPSTVMISYSSVTDASVGACSWVVSYQVS